MSARTPDTIRAKLTRIVLLTTLAALLVNALGLIALEVRSYRQQQLLAVRTQADVLARAAAAAVAFDDRKEAANALRLLRENRDIHAAAVYLQNGTLFAAYERGADKAPGAWQRQSGFTLSGNRIRGFHPIVEEGAQVGAVFLEVHYDLYDRLLQYAGVVALALAASLLAALLLSRALQRSVTGPIQDVTEAARKVIERNDYTVRAGHASNDETGVLADAFNQMLAEISRRSQELSTEIRDRQQAEAALRAADRRKDQFLATLAHELRNPLAPIRSSVDVLKLKGSRLETDVWARDTIDRQVAHMSRLLDDLLEVGRITTGKLKLTRQPVPFVAVIDAAIETSRPLIEANRQELVVDLPLAPLVLEGDAVRLCQVFANLLNNSARYTPAGGRISLRGEVQGGEVVVTVADNGIGIPAEALPSVFEIFSQATPALERSQGGLGIGLFLVRSLVRLHGGSVSARSEGPGRGTEIEVRLPLAAAGAAAPQALPAQDAQAGLRVLVVDDSVDAADSLAALLRILGHEVRVAHDGQDAVNTASVFRPHVAFLDIGMPRMNGYEAARHIRAQPWGRKLLLVAVTGWGQEEDRREAFAAGFDRHITKPARDAEVTELLRRAAAG